jgi:hypothetical protein
MQCMEILNRALQLYFNSNLNQNKLQRSNSLFLFLISPTIDTGDMGYVLQAAVERKNSAGMDGIRAVSCLSVA